MLTWPRRDWIIDDLPCVTRLANAIDQQLGEVPLRRSALERVLKGWCQTSIATIADLDFSGSFDAADNERV
jgi:hypothetical protein